MNIHSIFARYNKDQFTQCRLGEGATVDSTLITEYADMGNNRFFDPATNQTFKLIIIYILLIICNL